MKQIIIESLQIGTTDGGMACGPSCGHVVAEAEIRTGTGISYYGLVEVDGIPNFYTCKESRFQAEINEELDDDFPSAEEFCDYSEFFEAYNELVENDEAHALLLKLLICLVRSSWDETEKLKAAVVGRSIGTFEIPVCDVEEDFIEENE